MRAALFAIQRSLGRFILTFPEARKRSALHSELNWSRRTPIVPVAGSERRQQATGANRKGLVYGG